MKSLKNTISKTNGFNWNLLSEYRSELMGVAAILILIFHSILFCEDLYNDADIIRKALHIVICFLNVGVEIFLLVSGIGLYYAYEKKPKFKDYYTKRLLNVYVIFIIMRVFFNIIIGIVSGFTSVKDFIIDTLGLRYVFGIDNTDWYVPVIMILYLVFPLIYKFIKKIENSKLYTLEVSLIVLVYSAVMIAIKNTSFYQTYEIGFIRIPIFFIGCCLGKAVKEKKSFSPFFYACVLIGAVIKFIPQVRGDVQYSRLSSIFFSFFLIFVFIVIFKFLPSKVMELLRYIGGMSFELYIIHGILYNFCFDFFPEYHKTSLYVLTVFIAFIFSIMFSKIRKIILKQYSQRKLIK